MFCPNCGKECPDDFDYCSKCGTCLYEVRECVSKQLLIAGEKNGSGESYIKSEIGNLDSFNKSNTCSSDLEIPFSPSPNLPIQEELQEIVEVTKEEPQEKLPENVEIEKQIPSEITQSKIDSQEFHAIKTKLINKDTEELLAIWNENNRDEWRDEVFEVIDHILNSRGVGKPERLKSMGNANLHNQNLRQMGQNAEAKCQNSMQFPPAPPGMAPRLVLAAFENDIILSKTLILAGHPLEMRDPTGKTALIMAARWGHQEIVETLLNAGADINNVDSGGFSAIDEAACGGHKGIVELLKSRGARFDPIKLERLGSRKGCFGFAVFIYFLTLLVLYILGRLIA